MSDLEPVRTRAARAAAELALVRVVHHYGEPPGFVLLGGLVPDLLCADSDYLHAGTTDIDVQVDLEIAQGSVHTARLERALRNAEFEPTDDYVWRWQMTTGDFRAKVKFELLADQDHLPAQQVLSFNDCDQLGAVNLRGTGVATSDVEMRTIRARDGGVERTVELQVTGLAGYLLAKMAAARQRHKPKDLYDLAAHHTNLRELQANFTTPSDQGPRAYAQQLLIDHPEQDEGEVAADSVVAVQRFCTLLLEAI